MSRKTNQGQEWSTFLDDLRPGDLAAVAEVGWREVRNHGDDAICECPAIETLAKLYALGYRLVREDS